MELSSSSSAAAAGSMQFPEHMVEAVLVKLPVQTLLRLKLLSKSFKSIIEHPNFVAAPLHSAIHSHANPPSLALLTQNRNVDGRRVNKLLTLTKQHDDVQVIRKEVQVPTFASADVDDGPAPGIDLVGSQNGLICLCLRYFHPRKNKLVLWNPVTKQSRTLPPLPCSSNMYWVVDLGFAYNHETDDYMVSRIISNNYKPELSYQLDIFSMQRWGWQTYTYRRELPGNIPSGCMKSSCIYNPIALRGSIYKVVQQFGGEAYGWFVLAMDFANTIGNEIMFRRIEFPFEGIVFRVPKYLTVYGEGKDQSVGLLSKVNGEGGDEVPCYKCNLWVLRMANTNNSCDYVWTKLFTILIMHPISMDAPMTSWGDGRIVVERVMQRKQASGRIRRRVMHRDEESVGRSSSNTLYLYDRCAIGVSGEYIEEELVGATDHFLSVNVCPYVESLVSLHPI